VLRENSHGADEKLEPLLESTSSAYTLTVVNRAGIRMQSQHSRALALCAAVSIAALAASPRALALSQTTAPSSAANPADAWNAQKAALLMARAGFSATPDEVREAVAAGRDATVDRMLATRNASSKPEIMAERALHGGLVSPESLHARLDSRRKDYIQLQSDYFAPLNKYGVWWIERMLANDAPARDRMTLFWHGHLVSSFKEVGDAYAMIDQIQFLRDHALGPFDPLIRGIARDPAMLQYLSNAKNVKAHPNENWARELMELFTLGDGNYTEDDIKQAARAFTGWSKDGQSFAYHRTDHDFGQKTVLGVTGNLDGDDVIDVVLAQPVCARFLAGKIIAHFEGEAPDEKRLAEYADALRSDNYRIDHLLQKLFRDPRFYRDDIAGARVEAPVEYLIGVSRRLGLHPPAEMLMAAGTVIGQRVFFPPSVKGWEGGMAWINTGSIMQRSNMIGVLLGLEDVSELMGYADLKPGTKIKADENQQHTSGMEMLRYIQACDWKPELSLCDRVAKALPKRSPGPSDAEIVRLFLGDFVVSTPAAGTEEALERWLREHRTEAGVAEGALCENAPKNEQLLRRLAHLVLSLPEAQLD
jgi:uncharacterized protein (DUF1800 family)